MARSTPAPRPGLARFLVVLVLTLCAACAPRVPDDVGVTFGAGDLNRPSPTPYVAVGLTWHPNPVHVVIESVPPSKDAKAAKDATP